MTKLARYLKPFVVPILVVIGLLFMQAYCELINVAGLHAEYC